MSGLNEGVPPPTSPEQPPLAPYDPPAPAPQAAAWGRALRVIAHAELERSGPVTGPRTSSIGGRNGSGSGRNGNGRSGRGWTRRESH